ncbi:hypothetical protein BC567DRAFT_253376 [Phyllosticta citribraziliensis]
MEPPFANASAAPEIRKQSEASTDNFPVSQSFLAIQPRQSKPGLPCEDQSDVAQALLRKANDQTKAATGTTQTPSTAAGFKVDKEIIKAWNEKNDKKKYESRPRASSRGRCGGHESWEPQADPVHLSPTSIFASHHYFLRRTTRHRLLPPQARILPVKRSRGSHVGHGI